MGRHDIGMADQGHVAYALQAHNSEQSALLMPSPKIDPGRDFTREFRFRHIRLVPAIRRYDTPVCFGRVVDDSEYCPKVSSRTAPDQCHPSSQQTTPVRT